MLSATQVGSRSVGTTASRLRAAGLPALDEPLPIALADRRPGYMIPLPGGGGVAVPKQAKGARLARFHFALGRMLASMSAPGLAALALRDAVRAEPQLASAHFALGEALGRAGRWREAAAAYAAAARLRCDSEYQGNLVFALGRASLWQEALQASDGFGSSEDAEVLLVRGLILRRLGRANESILAFRRAVQIPARASGRRFFLGEALFGGEVWQATVGAHLQARGVRQKHTFGSRLNTAPARGRPVPQQKRVAPRRRRPADLAPALRRVAHAGLRAAWRSWQELRRGLRHAGVLLARLRHREPHNTLRVLRSAQRLDGVRYFSSARPTAHTSPGRSRQRPELVRQGGRGIAEC